MLGKYVKDKDKLYEVKENGERILVRSTESEARAYLRFTNKTTRTVTVWWRDFRGVKHQYLCLGPRAFSDINTYITHPWEFTDDSTKENYVVNNSMIFRPPQNLANMQHRTNWNITVGVRTLKFAAMLKIVERLNSLPCIKQLALPKNLEEDLELLMQGIFDDYRVQSDDRRF